MLLCGAAGRGVNVRACSKGNSACAQLQCCTNAAAAAAAATRPTLLRSAPPLAACSLTRLGAGSSYGPARGRAARRSGEGHKREPSTGAPLGAVGRMAAPRCQRTPLVAAPPPSPLQSATLALLNACLVGCALVCASLVFLPVGLPSELLPHIVGLLLLAVTLAGSVNWCVLRWPARLAFAAPVAARGGAQPPLLPGCSMPALRPSCPCCFHLSHGAHRSNGASISTKRRLVSLTGTVSPEEQQRELFGEARSELAPAGSSTSPLPPTSAPSPPPVEQPAAVPEPPLSAAALAGGAGGVEIGETTAAKDKDQ